MFRLEVCSENKTTNYPDNLDGRWIGVRLLDRLHKITQAHAEPDDKMAEYVNLWWEGAQLKLELYHAIAQSGSQTNWAKKAAQYGFQFGVSLDAMYPKMDGEERVADVKLLTAKLKALR